MRELKYVAAITENCRHIR